MFLGYANAELGSPRRKSGRLKQAPPQIMEAERKSLITTIVSQNFVQLREMLRAGAGLEYVDVDERLASGQHRGLTPLMVAVLHGGPSIVSTLLELSGCDPDVRAIPSDRTALHLAAESGFVAGVRALFQQGCSPDPVDRGGLTPLTLAVRSSAADTRHELCVAELVRRRASLLSRGGTGATALHQACEAGAQASTLVRAIVVGAEDGALGQAIAAVNEGGETPLHRACANGLSVASRELVEAGASANTPDGRGRTPLHVASKEGLEGVVKLMLSLEGSRRADVNAITRSGETPLHFALSGQGRGQGRAERGPDGLGSARGGLHGRSERRAGRSVRLLQGRKSAHERIGALLLAKGAYAHGKTSGGENGLHVCAREGNIELATKVLSQPPLVSAADGSRSRAVLDVNSRDDGGATPLVLAVAHGQGAMVELLLQQRGIDRSIGDAHGRTAVHIAVERRDAPMLRTLLSASTKSDGRCTPRELAVRNDLGWAPLHTSAFRGDAPTTRALLAAGAPPNQPTADGMGALHLAAAEGSVSVVAALLESQADPDAVHGPGETPLAAAAARGHDRVVDLLLQRGAHPSAAGQDGWSGTHAALWRGDRAVVDMVLSRGGELELPKGPWGVASCAGDPILHAQPALRSVLMQRHGAHH